ncbi:DUF948 domain-containing protein [Metaplanococcus flavidus]|uniref:DUF948 domain-containing protein n=1 Tax=Metaplanococcus flavidus TaxID=569883 RepID=A0ABW3LB56_9BACL
MDLTMWLWIALAILVVGLIIAGIGVGMFVKGMKEPMKKIKGSANNLKERVDKLNLEASSLTHTTTELQEEIAVKSEKVSVLTDAIKGTKNSLIDLNASVRSVTDKIVYRAEHDRENVRQVKKITSTTEDILHLPENLQTLNPDASNENYDTLYFGKVR